MTEIRRIAKDHIHLKIAPSAIQHQFISSKATLPIFLGPQGEGKTWAGAIAMWEHAQAHYQRTGNKLYGAIIRDTWINIKDMTLPSILEALPFLVTPTDSNRRIKSYNMDIRLIGIDDLGSLSKLQGDNPGFIWLEEPAPYAPRANAGLPFEVFRVALSRIGRQPGSIPRLQVTMNYPEEEHWTNEVLYDPDMRWFPLIDDEWRHDDFPDITLDLVEIPYGDNVYLTQQQRDMAKAAFKGDEGLIARFIKGEIGMVQIGEAVTPEFHQHIHKLKHDPKPMRGAQGFRFWDGGLNPTCIIGQLTPTGHLYIFESYVGDNIGVKQLIETYVLPAMDKYLLVKDWRDIGDRTMANRFEGDSNQSAAWTIKDMLNTRFEKGPHDWDTIRDAGKSALNRMIDGIPFIQIAASEKYLTRALRGGWHYAKDNTGRVIRDKPVKDRHSHPGDAFANGVSRILSKSVVEETYEKDRYQKKTYEPRRISPLAL